MITEKEFQMKLVEKLAPQYKQAKSKKVKVSISITTWQTHPGLKKLLKNASKYHILHQEIIKICWKILLCPCAKRLYPVVPLTIDTLLKEGHLKHYFTNIINETKTISLGTLKRVPGHLSSSSDFS